MWPLLEAQLQKLEESSILTPHRKRVRQKLHGKGLVREWIGLESPEIFGEGMDWAGKPWVFSRVLFSWDLQKFLVRECLLKSFVFLGPPKIFW